MQCKPVRKFSAFILKYFITIVFILSCNGCAIYPVKDRGDESRQTKQQDTQADAMTACPGNTDLPVALADQFEAVEDTALLLKMALGQLKKGKLCQGKVYKSKANRPVSVYRAWNSTNPKSKMGHWWAFISPTGNMSRYRSDYEICYQWSPLDKMTHCLLKADVKIVVGTGQSAECSEYLTYSASAEKQIYIDDATGSLINCKTYDAVFSWKAIIE